MALSNLDSITKRLIAQESGGILSRFYCDRIGAATTAANTTSGSVSAQRFPAVFTFPSLTGYTGWEVDVEIQCEDIGIVVAALEYDLGVLTVSSNTFAAGSDSSMPTKDTRISGTDYTSQQTASMIPMLVASSTLTATTPAITITYNNEDGTGSRTCSMTLPTNATINSAFDMTPHLNSGDTGLQDVSNMSKSAGTAGELRVKGLIPVVSSVTSIAQGTTTNARTIMKPAAPIIAVSGDKLAFYHFGSTTTKEINVNIYGRPI